MNVIVKKAPLLVFAVCICTLLPAQSMRWADGKEFARKLSENLYEPVPAGVVSCKIENDRFWILFNGVPQSDNPTGYYTYTDDEYVYYNGNDDIVGSYIPSQGRYYIITAKGKDILKSESYAVLVNGALYQAVNDETIVRYTVEEGFDPVVVGFFLLVQ